MRIDARRLIDRIAKIDVSITHLDREKRGRAIAELMAYCHVIADADELNGSRTLMKVAIERTAKELELADDLPWLRAAISNIERRRSAAKISAEETREDMELFDRN